jgi:hypothetical protein
MIAILNFPNHYKGDTFKNKQIIFNFDLTGATIKIKFKLQVNSPVAFFLVNSRWYNINN